jgi:hypothetical protein
MSGRHEFEEKQSFYSELLFIANSKRYSPNWASHKYREKFGVWPRKLAHMPKEPSIKTLNWVKHRNIAYSKSNRNRRVA